MASAAIFVIVFGGLFFLLTMLNSSSTPTNTALLPPPTPTPISTPEAPAATPTPTPIPTPAPPSVVHDLRSSILRPSNVREYFETNASEFQELIDEMNAEAAAMAAFGIDLSIVLEIVGDHTLRYDFIYGPGTELSPTAEADLAAELAGMASFQTRMAQEMRTSMDIDRLYINMRYLDSNGRVLAEDTFVGH